MTTEFIPDYSALEALDAEVHAIIDKADVCTIEKLSAARGTADELKAIADGCWQSAAIKAEQLIAKLSGKAVDYAVVRLSEAYAHAATLGVSMPSVHEILESYGDPVAPAITPFDISNDPTLQGSIVGQVGFYVVDIGWGILTNSLGTSSVIIVPYPIHYVPLNGPARDINPSLYYDGRQQQWLSTGNITNPVAYGNPSLTYQQATILLPQGSTGEHNFDLVYSLNAGESPNARSFWKTTAAPLPPIGTESQTTPTTTPTTTSPTTTPTTSTCPAVSTTTVTTTVTVSPTCPPAPPIGTPPPMCPPGQVPDPVYGQYGVCIPAPPIGTPPCPAPCPPVIDRTSPINVTVTGDKVPQSESGLLPDTYNETAMTPLMPASAGDWCSFIKTVTEQFAQIGDTIRTGKKEAFQAATYAAVATGLTGDQMVRKFLNNAIRDYTRLDNGAIQFSYEQTLANANIGDVQRVYNLLELKAYLEFALSYKIGSAQDQGHGIKMQLGTPAVVEELLIPVGVHLDSATGNAMHSGQDYSPVIIPLIELVDVCIKYALPTEVPGIAEAMDQYLHDQISEDQLKCLVQVNGGRWKEWQPTVKARREQLTADEWIRVWLRQEISEDVLDSKLRGLGYTDKGEVNNLKSLSQEVPAVQDVIRFMVRNIYDPDIVNNFHLDDEFGNKFQGQLVDWAKSNGLPLEAVQAFWRAHWVVPSPGQLYTMVQRLRPEKYGNDPAGLRTTIEDVNRALGENDVLPFWRRRLLEIAYNPLSRIDSRRLYVQGLISREDYLSSVKDIGYNGENAETLGVLGDKLRFAGLLTHWSIKLFERYGISEDQCRLALTEEGYLPSEIDSALDRVDTILNAEAQADCIKHLGQQFETGKNDEAETITALVRYGLNQSQIQRLVGQWKCNMRTKEAKEKTVPLCDWYMNGLITADEYSTRLTRMGYQPPDVTNSIRRCNLKVGDRQTKMLKSSQKAIEAEEKKVIQQRVKNQMDQERITKLANKAAKVNQSKAGVEIGNIVAALQLVQSQYNLDGQALIDIVIATADRAPTSGQFDVGDAILESAKAFQESLLLGQG